jgi:hypothetical protein
MKNNPEDYLKKNLKEELRENSLDSLDDDLVLEILKIAEKNSLDDDAKKRQDSIRALIKNLIKKNE